MDFFKIVGDSTDKLAERMKLELGKLQTQFFTYISQQETVGVE